MSRASGSTALSDKSLNAFASLLKTVQNDGNGSSKPKQKPKTKKDKSKSSIPPKAPPAKSGRPLVMQAYTATPTALVSTSPDEAASNFLQTQFSGVPRVSSTKVISKALKTELVNVPPATFESVRTTSQKKKQVRTVKNTLQRRGELLAQRKKKEKEVETGPVRKRVELEGARKKTLEEAPEIAELLSIARGDHDEKDSDDSGEESDGKEMDGHFF
ncbi:hypothetical protein Pelo_3960 [Pelomyxa schiedti]|nr:hypothetical protein Pelo_3960 [Pelomyxa schiedti]